jgi:tRNA (adenine57-N1/adenine58-N1)-methyltransferase
MIGLPFGSKMYSHNNRGYVYLLRPTPEIWTLVLPHRTQILYMPDIAFISSQLRVKNGTVVVESGTGSGSFTHSLARSAAPSGHVYTYEFHEERANLAAKEFTAHGMDDVVTVTCRNVCKDGFTVVGVADAVFLDLPAPWEAIPHAVQVFKQHAYGRICTFSPCIEQVQRSRQTLVECGFAGRLFAVRLCRVEIQVFECLIKSYDVRTVQVMDVEEEVKKTRHVIDNKKRKQGEDVEQPVLIKEQCTVTSTSKEIRGHTSYLMFATFSPRKQ